MNWKEYESITKYIYETLGEKTGVKIICHGNNCKVRGKSNVEHQIDVLTSHSDGIHTYKTAVECKYWNEKISKDIVMKVSEIIEDAAINKGVIVSKEGFTPDGIAFAQYKNIGLIELREIDERDNKIAPQIKIKAQILRTEILKVTIDNHKNDKGYSGEANIENLKIITSVGSEILFQDLINKFKKEPSHNETGKVFKKHYPFPNATLRNTSEGSVIRITGITFHGVVKATDLNFRPVDEVWLIMKSIFEEKYFTISKGGVIRESGNKHAN